MAVPDTNTFGLQEVCTELGLTGSNRTLTACFANAIADRFDPAYSGNKNSLYNFRNYKPKALYRTAVLVTAIHTLPLGPFSNITNVSAELPWEEFNVEDFQSLSGYGKGLDNSLAIVNQPGHINSAAKLCLDYSHGGYSDFYLGLGREVSTTKASLITTVSIANGGDPFEVGDYFGGFPGYHLAQERSNLNSYVLFSSPSGSGDTSRNFEKSRMAYARPVKTVYYNNVPNLTVGEYALGGVITQIDTRSGI